MSIRLRLALWYGSLFAVILLVVTVFSYAFHARGHYDDIDRALITTAAHAADEAKISPSAMAQLLGGGGGYQVALRLYGADGRLIQSSVGAEGAPLLDPRTVLQHPAGPAFDPVAGIAPPIAAPSPTSGAAFGLANAADQRWRMYVLPINSRPGVASYVEASTPLGAVDHSLVIFRLLLLGLSCFGLAAALVGSWLVAGKALQPVADMTGTADGIARSHDLSQRIAVPRHHDEIGQLARTFNAMLASIEGAYAAQQRFVSDASHELRAPLTAIQANLELIERHPDMSAAERDEAVAEAERESSRLGRLVADLLALARADAGVPLNYALVDLDTVVLESVGAARTLTHGQVVTLDTFEPIQVQGNEDRLKQLLFILLDNALKYTLAGGTVAVGLRRVELDGEGAGCLTIRDTGVGIPEQDLPHVFERFYRADPGRSRDPGGTGLGLPIAQWIVEQHGGRIDLASRPGEGTTVTVRLPCVGGDQSNKTPHAGAGGKPPARKDRHRLHLRA
jgi:signal transduction histidine kinase